MQSAFNPDAFMQSSYDSGFDTRMIPHPAGDGWRGYIGTDAEKDIVFKQTAKGSTVLEIYIYTEDPAVCDVTGRKPNRVKWSTFVDVTDSGGLDMGEGKNRRIGQMLSALGFQDPDGSNSKPWRFTDFIGQPLQYSVSHRPADDGTGNVYDEVKSVTRP